MTATQEIGHGELDRLNAVAIGRPSPERDRWGRWHRDPGGEWDWFYALPAGDQDYVRRNHMVELGVRPDELADWLGAHSIDDAMTQWLEAVEMTRKSRIALVDPLSDEWESLSSYDDDVTELMGPDEVADLLQVQRNTIAVWRHRGLMPAPAVVLSSLPIWRRGDILEWAERTGRLVVKPPEQGSSNPS